MLVTGHDGTGWCRRGLGGIDSADKMPRLPFDSRAARDFSNALRYSGFAHGRLEPGTPSSQSEGAQDAISGQTWRLDPDLKDVEKFTSPIPLRPGLAAGGSTPCEHLCYADATL